MQRIYKYLAGRIPKIFVVFPLFLIQTDQQPVDNLNVLNSLASTMVRRIVDRLTPDSTASVLIKSQSKNREGNWWIESLFAKDLVKRGVTNLYINQENVETDFVIDYKILELGVRYNLIDNTDLVGRYFDVALAVRAIEGRSGLVKFVAELKEPYADSVNVKNINRLENKDFLFTQASLPEKKGIKKYIEPLIVMTTTAGIIYLFFRMRSN